MASLRHELGKMLESLNQRINFLEDSIKDYKDLNQFDSALRCSIKKSSFKLVVNNLEEILSDNTLT